MRDPPATSRSSYFWDGVAWAGSVAHLGAQTLRRSLLRPATGSALVNQIDAVGVSSLAIVLLTAVFSSMVMTVQFALQLARFGARDHVGPVVSLSLTRELAPVLTALLVGGRVGAGMAAELGAMKVTEQIDALRAMGGDPVRELVVPRVLAVVVCLPLLTLVADVLGVGAGMGIAWLDGSSSAAFFFNASVHAVRVSDLASGLFKTVFFGLGIALIACHEGLHAEGGTRGVGAATTRTVVITSIVTLISDFFLTKLLLRFGL